jgi:hypothetical protein
MKKIVWGTAIALACGACSSPAAPSELKPRRQGAKIDARLMGDEAPPLYVMHGTPVAMPDGEVAYVCVTGVREYLAPDGHRTWERDAYVAFAPCPVTPIE